MKPLSASIKVVVAAFAISRTGLFGQIPGNDDAPANGIKRLLLLAILSLWVPACFQPTDQSAAIVESDFPSVVRPFAQFGVRGSQPGTFNEPSDVAINDDNLLYVAECFNDRVQVLTLTGEPVRSWGVHGTGQGQFDCPRGIAVADGRVYVADLSHRIQVFDLGGAFQHQWGSYGTLPGELNAPWRLTAAHGVVAVADAGNARVQVFTPSGNLISTCGSYGIESGQFSHPKAVAVDGDGYLYVSDTFNHRIQKLGPDCGVLGVFGEYGSYEGRFAEPSDVHLVGDQLFVVDQVNHRAQAIATDGAFSFLWGRHPATPHAGEGRLHYPGALTVDPTGSTAAICEPFENRCQVFAVSHIRAVPPTNELAWWNKYPMFHYGRGGETPNAQMLGLDHDVMVVTEPDIGQVIVFDINEDGRPIMRYRIGGYGTTSGRFRMPSGVSVSAQSELFVSDALNHRVQAFDFRTGEYLREFGSRGQGPGEFNEPGDLATTVDGTVFVADFHNHRIQVFDTNGQYLREFGEPGQEVGQLNRPITLRIHPEGDALYVVDNGNRRVQIFDLAGQPLGVIGGDVVAGREGQGSFLWPFGLDFDPSDGSVYVSDPGLQLIQKFDSDGNFLTQWGGWGSEPGRFYKPKGLMTDSSGRIYVLDFGNHRGQIFNSDGEFLAIFGEGIFRPVGN